MAEAFFTEVPERIRFGGLASTEPLTYKVYDPDRLVLGKRMEDHLRPGVCFWHSFAWAGVDMFGIGTLDRPWLAGSVDPMDGARTKMAVAFEFFEKIGIPYYCFHDRDVAPETGSFAEFRAALDALSDDAAGYRSGPVSGCCGGRPTCSPIRATRPAPPPIRIPRCSPTPRRRSSTCSR